jgi:threonyl-tRNA synthetase
MNEAADPQDSEPINVLRHSAAHLLAAAVTELWPDAKYAFGPWTSEPPGFYYDFELEHRISEDDLPRIEERMREIAARNPAYERQLVPRAEARAIFEAKGQAYKLYVIDNQAAGDEEISLYRTGDFLDICRGPHVRSAGEIQAFKLTRLAGAYWLNDERNQQLQRVYGTAWKSQADLDAYLELMEEAERRDHKRLGRELKLFMLDERTGAGNVIWLPDGATIRRELERWVIDEEVSRGYRHVRTPDIAKRSLYDQSGHTELFSQSMFPPMNFPDGDQLQLRPVNCPHHILVYQSELRSYRDLPLRIAEIGNMYRYEKSGELMGMIRVRIIALNDAHIFCTPDQLQEEIKGAIDISLYFMNVLGVNEFEYRISTRDDDPSHWLGGMEDWQRAQKALMEALDSLGQPYRVAEGEAAFYGPKIDFQVRDAAGREFTNSTVQVDFQMPQRFDLEYVAPDGTRQRPIMVHRGAFGAFERMTAYLIEHYAGAFPTWLHPVQVIVANLNDETLHYAREVHAALRNSRLRAELDDRQERLSRKKFDAIHRKVPYFVVVGPRDAAAGNVSVRNRADEQTVEPLAAFVERVATEVAERRRE